MLSRKCFGNNGLFQTASHCGFRIQYRNTPAVAIALEDLLPDPDAAFSADQIFKHGTRTHCGKVMLGGKSYFLKRYNDRGLWYRLRHMFKQSRSIRTWRIGWDFFTNQVPVPQPLICLEERGRILLHRCYILMELVEGGEPLDKVWATLSASQKTGLLAKLAETLGKMHKTGRVHGDLKWSNILVNKSGEPLTLTLVDLDSCSFTIWRRRSLAHKDIDLFLFWLDHYEPDKSLQQRFLESWRGWLA